MVSANLLSSRYLRLTFFSLFLLLKLSAQTQLECSVNVDPDYKLCYNQPMILNAPISQDYNVNPNPEWTFLSGPQSAPPLQPNTFSTPASNGPNWALGAYVFKFCATCKDIDGNGINDRPCDEITITVMPDVEPPTISPASLVGCKQAAFTVTPPGPDETASVYIDDGGRKLFETMLVGNQLIVSSTKIGQVDYLTDCDFEVIYTITNGGCSASASAMIRLTAPYDKNNDGIVEGHVEPSCDNTIQLRGDRPGCGGQGTWTVTGPGAVTFTKQDLPNGDADVTVTAPGLYTLTYTVTGIAPCPPSTYTIQYQVVDLNGFALVPERQEFPFCDNTLPAGKYCFTYNLLEHATYEWSLPYHHQSEVVITDPHNNTSCLEIANPIDLTDHSVYISVVAARYYLDIDCDGPMLPTLIEIPSMDPDVSQPYIDSVYLANIDTVWAFVVEPFFQDTIWFIESVIFPCTSSCWAYANINFFGVPKVEIKSDHVQFLCSDCSEGVILNKYFKVVNGVITTNKVTVVGQPAGSSPIIDPKAHTETKLIGCGDYTFRIDIIPFFTSDPACKKTIFITVSLRAPKPVSAGTPQEKCYNEPIRLNGTIPYGPGVQGTWKQVDCPGSDPSSGTAVFSEHDPNTLVSHGLAWGDLPKRLCFEWSFSSEDTTCNLSDITWVDVEQCTIPCPRPHVKSVCEEDRISLTLLDANDVPIGAPYNIHWTISGGTPLTGLNENPLVVLNGGNPVTYTAVMTLVIEEEKVCEETVSGVATCGPEGCNARVVESCDACGMIKLTLVNIQTGQTIVPHTYDDEMTWWVNGQQHKNENPILISPGSCYKLQYFHYTYTAGEPHVPGLADICEFEVEETCPTLECPGPCSDFPTFIVAGYGDALATSLGLVFPPNSYSFCGTAYGLYGTIGVFTMPGGVAVDPGAYDILWENGSTSNFVTGSLMNIDYVKITKKGSRCCFWEAKYRPVCCEIVPTQVHCENPTIKHCDDEGNVTYTNGSPQIAWQSVTGATGYEIRVTTLPGGTVTIYPVPYSPWIIPAGNNCILVEVRAVFPEGMCSDADWSEPFEYCRLETECERTLVICGCCGGGHRDATTQPNLREVVVPESTLNALLAANPGPRYASLQQALNQSKQVQPTTFLVFPNPATTKLELRTAGLTVGSYTVHLYDLLGRTRLTERFTDNASNTLEVGDLPTGIYTLTIKDAGGTSLYHQKVSIVRGER